MIFGKLSFVGACTQIQFYSPLVRSYWRTRTTVWLTITFPPLRFLSNSEKSNSDVALVVDLAAVATGHRSIVVYSSSQCAIVTACCFAKSIPNGTVRQFFLFFDQIK